MGNHDPYSNSSKEREAAAAGAETLDGAMLKPVQNQARKKAFQFE